MKNNIYCPVQCKYCMASKINCRSKYRESGSRLGINKSCVFVNRLPGDPPLKNMDFDWNLVEGDYLGFQGITDCFWNKYFEDLEWIVNKIENTNIRKLVLVSKIPVNKEQIDILKQTNKVIVIYSLTGLDALENTKTLDRVEAMIELRDAGIDTLGIIHPYIHGYADLSFLKKLHDNNFHLISYKGFRYNPENMKVLKKYIPEEILKQYEKNESEVMIGNDYLKQQLQKYGFQYIDLKKYIRQNNRIKLNIDRKLTIKQVEKLLQVATISSSETNMKILKEEIVKRRLGE